MDDNRSDTTEIIQSLTWKADEDVWDVDPNGLYGLKIEFLKSLHITPPIDRWVHVSNFRCDKVELKDVMELAGHVLTCSVIKISRKFAKVQYRHPLEAVQAVSLLNGQIFYGSKLKVEMENNPNNDIILPRGLANIGLGFGIDGRPIRDIVRNLKKYAQNKKSELNPILFRTNDEIGESSKGKGDIHDTNESVSDINKFIKLTNDANFWNERPYRVRSAFSDSGETELLSDTENVKSNVTPGLSSTRSADTTASNTDMDKSSDRNKNASTSSLQPDIPGSESPIKESDISISFSNPSPTPSDDLPSFDLKSVSSSQSNLTVLSYNRPIQSVLLGNRMPNQQPSAPVPIRDSNAANIPKNQSLLGPYSASHFIRPVGPNTNQDPRPILGSMSVSPNNRGPMPISPTNRGPMNISPTRPNISTTYSQPCGPPISFSSHIPRPNLGMEPKSAPGFNQGMSMNRMPIMPNRMQSQSFPGPSQGFRHPGPIGPNVMPMGNPMQNQRPIMGPGPIGPPSSNAPMGMPRNGTSVQLSNLPPNTTFPFLCQKMSECGQVMSLRFTTMGCAIVTFNQPLQADRCYKTYNGMTVEGHRINVEFM